MGVILIIDRKTDGRLVVSQDRNLVTDTSISLSEREIEVIYSIYKKMKYNGRHPEDILKYVCDLCKVTRTELQSRNRSIEYTLPRQLYCYAARKLTNSSLAAIGAYIKRDHATVKHSVKVIEIYQELHYKKVTDLVNNILNFFSDGQREDNVGGIQH